MTIDLSRSTDPRIAVASHVLAEVHAAIGGRRERLMVIGATARDILSVALTGEPPSRATADVDIAVAVPSWEAYDEVAAHLDHTGRREHTYRVAGLPVDIVPFGGIETSSRTIDWRDGGRMSAFGLREAYDAAAEAALPGGVRVRVPSVAGVTLLKLMAWSDRRLETRRDAVDLQTIIGWYATGTLLDELYETHAALLEAYDFDPDLASAHRLGRDVAGVLGSETSRLLTVLGDDDVVRLAADMPATVADDVSILLALRAGLGERTRDRP